MEHRHKSHFISLLIIGILISGPLAAAKVYRWVDENGEVHYSETLPPDFEDKSHDVLNKKGVVVAKERSLKPPPPKPKPKPNKNQRKELPRDASGLRRPKELYSEAETQRRMDSFLMLRYESEREITDAMNVEIKQLEYDRRLLITTRKSTQKTHRGKIKQAANTQRSGKQVGDKVFREINQLSSRLAQNNRELKRLKDREKSIRADFGKQLTRYRFLEQKEAEESSDS